MRESAHKGIACKETSGVETSTLGQLIVIINFILKLYWLGIITDDGLWPLVTTHNHEQHLSARRTKRLLEHLGSPLLSRGWVYD